MSITNDGGPAFPIDLDQHADDVSRGYLGISHWTMGMSLRDYFAAHYRADFSNCDLQEEVKERYAYADAMLLERGQG